MMFWLDSMDYFGFAVIDADNDDDDDDVVVYGDSDDDDNVKVNL